MIIHLQREISHVINLLSKETYQPFLNNIRIKLEIYPCNYQHVVTYDHKKKTSAIILKRNYEYQIMSL